MDQQPPSSPPKPSKRGPRPAVELDGALTFKERLFVSYYLGPAAGNPTEAARMAGYKDPRRTGSKLCTKVDISTAIAQHLERAAMSADEALARVSCLATGDLTQFIDVTEDGEIQVDWVKAKRLGLSATVRTLRRGRYGLEISLFNVLDSLALLLKYHGLLQDRNPLRDQPDEVFMVELTELLTRLLPRAPTGKEGEVDA